MLRPKTTIKNAVFGVTKRKKRKKQNRYFTQTVSSKRDLLTREESKSGTCIFSYVPPRAQYSDLSLSPRAAAPRIFLLRGTTLLLQEWFSRSSSAQPSYDTSSSSLLRHASIWTLAFCGAGLKVPAERVPPSCPWSKLPVFKTPETKFLACTLKTPKSLSTHQNESPN